jgi:hypothetical protein
MGGAVPPLPQYAFMAWCSGGAEGHSPLTERGFYLLPEALDCRIFLFNLQPLFCFPELGVVHHCRYKVSQSGNSFENRVRIVAYNKFLPFSPVSPTLRSSAFAYCRQLTTFLSRKFYRLRFYYTLFMAVLGLMH